MQQGLIFRGFIASPSDVEEERDAAADEIAHWNGANSLARAAIIEPVRIETHARSALGAHPQEIINKQLLDRCDFLIAIFWSRLGTPTANEDSGTIDEIKEFAKLNGSEHVKLFFSNKDLPADHDRDQLRRLRDFKREMETQGLYCSFRDVDDFKSKLRDQLDMLVNATLPSRSAIVGTLSQEVATVAAEIDLSDDAKKLLLEAADDPHGDIAYVRSSSGTEIVANDHNFTSPHDARSVAKWTAALKELAQNQLVQGPVRSGYSLPLTHKGYQWVDRLRSQ